MPLSAEKTKADLRLSTSMWRQTKASGWFLYGTSPCSRQAETQGGEESEGRLTEAGKEDDEEFETRRDKENSRMTLRAQLPSASRVDLHAVWFFPTLQVGRIGDLSAGDALRSLRNACPATGLTTLCLVPTRLRNFQSKPSLSVTL